MTRGQTFDPITAPHSVSSSPSPTAPGWIRHWLQLYLVKQVTIWERAKHEVLAKL